MPRGTAVLFFVLTAVAFILIGINIGKRAGFNGFMPPPTPTPYLSVTPTVTPSRTPSPTPPPPPPSVTGFVSGAQTSRSGISTYTDRACGFTFSYPGSYMQTKSVNGQATILTEENNPGLAVAVYCAFSLPRPPVSSDKIEATTIGGQSAVLYHDANPDASPRDEVIVKHPKNGNEIIVAGFGQTFQTILASFKFL